MTTAGISAFSWMALLLPLVVAVLVALALSGRRSPSTTHQKAVDVTTEHAQAEGDGRPQGRE